NHYVVIFNLLKCNLAIKYVLTLLEFLFKKYDFILYFAFLFFNYLKYFIFFYCKIVWNI
ncbi:hypothetical protein C1645_779750, partial [Glomus cerebriforme]